MLEAEEGQRQGGGEREKTRKLFPNSSRERKREGKGEELREGLCIVSSSECSKCWQFFFLFFFFTVLFPIRSNRTRGRGREKREERRARAGKAGAAVKEALKRRPTGEEARRTPEEGSHGPARGSA